MKREAVLRVALIMSVIGLLYYLGYLLFFGYLPAPFLYDKRDTFMDFFNVSYWAYKDDRYLSWGAVYPALSFLVVKCFYWVTGVIPSGNSSMVMRDASAPVFYLYFMVFLISPLAWLYLERKEYGFSQMVAVYFISIISTPALFALERGNLIVLAPVFLALYLVRKDAWRAFSVAVLVNLKPYFILLFIPLVYRGNMRLFVISVYYSLALFVVSGTILDPYYWQVIPNLFSFGSSSDLFSIREVLSLPASLSAYKYVLGHPSVIGSQYYLLYGGWADLFGGVVGLMSLGGVVAALLALYLYKDYCGDDLMLVVLVVVITNLSYTTGGYSLILYFPLIAVFGRLRYARIYLLLLLFLVSPVDIIPLAHSYIGEQYSYLCGRTVGIDWTLGAGALIRPVLNYFLLLLVTVEVYKKNQLNQTFVEL
ncbi:hypothetical protein [Chlorobium sp. N1]|uniref:hypothetical protein n=1 Tax=Chlorobium sp. N1 TaxID=2491138 RepID=UPI00103FC5B4|nr:hypothetical protein [Chlorobium sp. N1]TCD46863.1 hypothetical protein E0L29_11070 [Chlorobium sp. N1]